jgi:hypothetical protein
MSENTVHLTYRLGLVIGNQVGIVLSERSIVSMFNFELEGRYIKPPKIRGEGKVALIKTFS